MTRQYLGEYAGGIELAFQNALAAQDPTTAQAIAQTQLPGQNWIDAALRVAQSAVLADSQRRLLNIQIERAKQGLPPLDSSQYGLGVNVGLSPDVMKYAGIGLGVLALILLMKRGR